VTALRTKQLHWGFVRRLLPSPVQGVKQQIKHRSNSFCRALWFTESPNAFRPYKQQNRHSLSLRASGATSVPWLRFCTRRFWNRRRRQATNSS